MPCGLYLHYPFSRHRCIYCDSDQELYEPARERRFFRALLVETDLAARLYSDVDNKIAAVFVGGGMPSLTDLSLLQQWVEQVRRFFDIAESVEFSFEFSPESVNRKLLETLKELGVNRPIFGVQSFAPEFLNWLGWPHTLHQVHESIYYANVLGFESYGCDLLYGLPGQTGKKLSADLDQITDLDPPHISFRQLTGQPGSELAKQVERGLVEMPDPGFIRALAQAGHEHLTEHGYVQYEDDSFAKPGHESWYLRHCRTGGDYVGLGPSAQSLINGKRYTNLTNLSVYIETLESGHYPTIDDRIIE